MNILKGSFAVLTLSASILSFASPGVAFSKGDPCSGRVIANGLSANGVTGNGQFPNGTTNNGQDLNGQDMNGRRNNGIRTNGPKLNVPLNINAVSIEVIAFPKN